MSKHTKGPWYLRLSDNATPHIEHGDCFLDDVGCLENRICVMPAEITRKYNSLANAHLIAAAPDLLEALEECRRELFAMIEKHNKQDAADGAWLYDYQTVAEADTAIAKARGIEQ